MRTSIRHTVLFQSIYAQSRRWKRCQEVITLIEETGFNPFMPKAGVGSQGFAKAFFDNNQVSIHLCPKQALEVFPTSFVLISQICFNPFMPKAGVGRQSCHFPIFQALSFNPFMPKAGVGSADSRLYQSTIQRVSIHLCPKQALEEI